VTSIAFNIALQAEILGDNTDYKSKCAFGSFQSQRRFDLVTAFTIVNFKMHLWRILKYNWYKMQIHAALPIEVKYTEQGLLTIGNIRQEVEFVGAIGKLHLINTRPELAKWFAGVLMGMVVVFLYIFIMFRRFIGNVYRGIVFERFNIRMLQNIAYGLAALWIFSAVYSSLFYFYVAKNLTFEHLEVSGSFESYDFILIAALMLWVLSHIFMHGVRLQEDQKLTV
jgi:hypothetical protein